MKGRVAVLLLALLGPAAARAQAISPGKLSSAHASLEGTRNCTRCHELRRPGAAGERCLACHEPLRARIQQGVGLHGRMRERACGECHKEHFGRDFQLVRQADEPFDHARTGYVLEGAHARAECRACHRPELIAGADVKAAAGTSLHLARTSLGLARTCRSCHATEDPHGGQFRTRDCAECHTPDEWERAVRFDHDVASYRLTGRHREVECRGCHREVTRGGRQVVAYTGVDVTSCRSCHDDAHGGAMGEECARCHTTAGWQRVSAAEVARRFDHGSTSFALRGAHARASCESCHQPGARPGIRLQFAGDELRRTYPRPAAAACTSCHPDPHGPSRAARGDCRSCHSEEAWTGGGFDAVRHAGTSFPLTGAHLAVPCGSCHQRSQAAAPHFGVADASCAGCHRRQDPHGSAFAGRACDECHTTASFAIAEWDHARAPDLACTSCHTEDNPHGTQFAGRPCQECHATSTFRITSFDHGRTRFPLEGRHALSPCSACHVPVSEGGTPVVRYRPLAMRCEDCHGGAP